MGSNPTSTATDLQEYRFLAAARRVSRHPLAHLFVSVMSRVRRRRRDEPGCCAWSQTRRTSPDGEVHAAEACALPFTAGRERPLPAGSCQLTDRITLSDRGVLEDARTSAVTGGKPTSCWISSTATERGDLRAACTAGGHPALAE